MDHRCAVAERFGTSDRAAECAKAVLYGRDVRQEFPEEVLAEAHAYDNALIDPAEAAHRAALRGVDKATYLRREKVWAVVCVVVGCLMLAEATYYNLVVRPNLGA